MAKQQEYQPHLYMICYPNAALVLSQLAPDQFGYRYNFGSTSYYAGKLIFAEIDINYRHPYFKIDEALADLKAHPDGRPKATKYVSAYRVLEHIEVDAIQTLYLANADGTSYPLKSEPFEYNPQKNVLRVFAEITPVTMLTISKYNMREFGNWFTDPKNPIHVPRLLYAMVTMDFDNFLNDFENNPLMLSPLEDVHPSKLRDAILEMRQRDDKFVKGITLNATFSKESYRKIHYGFMIADQKTEKFFRMPSLSEIEKNNLRFYKGM